MTESGNDNSGASNAGSGSAAAGSTWTSSLKSWRSILPGYGSKPDEDNTIPDPDPSSHQVTDYQEGDRRDIYGNIVHLGNPQQEQQQQQQQQPSTVPPSSLLPPSEPPIPPPSQQQPEDLTSVAPNVHQAQDTRHPNPQNSVSQKPSPIAPPSQERNAPPTTAAKVIEKTAGKALNSISEAVKKRRKNVVLPNYYEQFPDVRPSLLLSVPVGSAELAMIAQGAGAAAAAIGSSFTGKVTGLVWSAVNGVRALFSLPRLTGSNEPTSPKAKGARHRGTHGIRRVAIIGVHGWYPRRALRTVIGEPTGTSVKFCEEMDLALKEYLHTHGKHLDPEDVTLIPLESEGKVLDRVENLHHMLLENPLWRHAVHEADLVLVATHSQGTPTSILLVERWVKEGLLRVKEDDPKMQRIGVLAMAGISHGPFPFLKGNLFLRLFEAEAAAELFEFMDSETVVAKKYREGLRTVLTSGIRITCVASLEDQVVPLYSAVMTSIHHPSIIRAVYIDAASYQNDFLINLIAFSLRLRNAGVDDHGILVQLSEVIAGSIYGEGHSAIYEEREVYL